MTWVAQVGLDKLHVGVTQVGVDEPPQLQRHHTKLSPLKPLVDIPDSCGQLGQYPHVHQTRLEVLRQLVQISSSHSLQCDWSTESITLF